MMPKIRVRSSKPNHPGGYNQGRKLEKARNHTHKFTIKKKLNGNSLQYCIIPKCKEHNLME